MRPSVGCRYALMARSRASICPSSSRSPTLRPGAASMSSCTFPLPPTSWSSMSNALTVSSSCGSHRSRSVRNSIRVITMKIAATHHRHRDADDPRARPSIATQPGAGHDQPLEGRADAGPSGSVQRAPVVEAEQRREQRHGEEIRDKPPGRADSAASRRGVHPGAARRSPRRSPGTATATCRPARRRRPPGCGARSGAT